MLDFSGKKRGSRKKKEKKRSRQRKVLFTGPQALLFSSSRCSKANSVERGGDLRKERGEGGGKFVEPIRLVAIYSNSTFTGSDCW